MKKIVSLLVLIALTSIGSTSGQEMEQSKKSICSLTFGYAPDYNFNLINQFPSEGDVCYLVGFIARANFKLLDRLSLSVGIYPRNREKNYLFEPSDSRNPNFYDVHETRFFLEFPVQINYNLNRSDRSFKPYLKFALRNAYYKYKLQGEDQDGPVSFNDKQYNLLSDFGMGSNINIARNLSIVTELCFGYCLIFDYRNRGYIDGVFGIQYDFY